MLRESECTSLKHCLRLIRFVCVALYYFKNFIYDVTVISMCMFVLSILYIQLLFSLFSLRTSSLSLPIEPVISLLVYCLERSNFLLLRTLFASSSSTLLSYYTFCFFQYSLSLLKLVVLILRF
jgi:hypothetical protein